MDDFSQVFWSEKFWLPPNVTWSNVTSSEPSDNYSSASLLWSIPLSLLMLMQRFVMEKYLLSPLCHKLCMRNVKPVRPAPNATLESLYVKQQRLSASQLEELSKKLDKRPKEVKRWWRARCAQDRPTTFKKFCGACWMIVNHITGFILALNFMWDEEYFWDFKQALIEYPYHTPSTGIQFYNIFTLSFYFALTFMHLVEERQKDFGSMFVHHIIAISLVLYGWTCNFHRLFSLVQIVHDCPDTFIEAARMLRYAKFNASSKYAFGLFAMTSLMTRLVLFPQIVYVTFVYLPIYPGRLLCNILLLGISSLHMYWTFLLFQAVGKLLTSQKFSSDRSDSENENDTD